MQLLGLGSANITNTWWPHAPLRIFTLFSRFHAKLKFSTSSSKVISYFDKECNDFLPWLEQKACMEISSVLSIGKSAYGRSLYASKSIQAGDCILRVPYRVQLAPDNLPSQIHSSLGDEVSNVTKVAILLLHEQKLGQKSDWAPYISRLPQPSDMQNTILWSDDELEMIRQSAIYQETIKQRNRIQKEFMAIKPALDHFPECFSDVSLKDFTYAHALVTSRAWESSRGVSMIPFADFLNHDGASETCLLSDESKQFSEVSSSLLLGICMIYLAWKLVCSLIAICLPDMRLGFVIADCDYIPGDQVLIRYGKFSNGTLILDFGFTLPYNINDQVQVELNIPQDDQLRQMKLDLLHRYRAPAIKDVNEFSSSEKFFTIKEVKSSCRKGRGIPQSFRAFARVLCSNSQELSDLASDAAQNDGRLARSPMKNKSREIEAHQLMLSKITQLVMEYDASIKSLGPSTSQDITKTHACRMQLARDLLSGEFRVLTSSSAWLKNYCATLSEG